MSKKVFQTTEFKRIDKSHWPHHVQSFLNDPDPNSIHPNKYPKICYEKFNTGSYPRIAFIEEKRPEITDTIIYVPRLYFKEHADYERFDKLSFEEQLRKCKYVNDEEDEINAEFERFYSTKNKRDTSS